jgi:hypothetical protein
VRALPGRELDSRFAWEAPKSPSEVKIAHTAIKASFDAPKEVKSSDSDEMASLGA